MYRFAPNKTNWKNATLVCSNADKSRVDWTMSLPFLPSCNRKWWQCGK